MLPWSCGLFARLGGSGLLTGGISSSAGISEQTARDVLVAPFNNLEAVQEIMDECGDEVAAIIVEPVAGNMGLIKPQQRFLEGLREISHSCGALLIFDEVISGFRLGPTSFGNLCGVHPDLTCLGKIIGGGMPIGALAGPQKIMECLAPIGEVYQAGTLSGNPISVAAGMATLTLLKEHNPYLEIEKKCKDLVRGIEKAINPYSEMCHCAHLGGMFTLFFAPPRVNNLADAKRCRTEVYAEFFHYMISQKIYLPPSQFEVCFISVAHTDADISRFIEAISTFQWSRKL